MKKNNKFDCHAVLVTPQDLLVEKKHILEDAADVLSKIKLHDDIIVQWVSTALNHIWYLMKILCQKQIVLSKARVRDEIVAEGARMPRKGHNQIAPTFENANDCLSSKEGFRNPIIVLRMLHKVFDENNESSTTSKSCKEDWGLAHNDGKEHGCMETAAKLGIRRIVRALNKPTSKAYEKC